MIIGEVFGAEQVAREVVAEYPNVAFLMGSSFKEDAALPNFADFENYIQGASYLSRIIAGSMITTGNIGMVGGFPIPEVNRLKHAYMVGALEMNPDITLQVSFIGSLFDPPKGKETAFAMIENGAGLLYAERFCVSNVAKEKGILAISNVIDTQGDYPETVAASAIWHFEPTFDKAIAEVQVESFVAADYGVYSFMNQGGTSLAPSGTFDGKVPAAAMDLVSKRTEEIKLGAVTMNDER